MSGEGLRVASALAFWRPGGGPDRRLAATLVGALALGACSDAGPEVALVIDAPTSTEVVVGDFLTLEVSATDDVPVITWTSSAPGIADVQGGVVEALRPGAATITASAPEALSGTVDLTVVARPGGYTAAEVDYFGEIAFGSEFGTSEQVLHRWPAGSGPLIRVNGSPTAADLVVLDSVIAEINRLAPVDIEIVKDFPTLEMHFVPEDDFQSILPQAPLGNIGIVWLWWDGGGNLFQSVVLIATDIRDEVRAHIIREELTQSLGLLRDSFTYPQSIFYQGASEVTEYLPIDRVVIELLYRPELSAGMTVVDAMRGARLLTRPSPALTGSGIEAHAPRGAAPGTWRAVSGAPGSAGGSSSRR